MISEGVLGEVEKVLKRPKFRRYLPEEEVETYLQRLREVAAVSEATEPGAVTAKIEGTPVSTADPKDDYLLALGLDRTIVSGDRHLLDVGELHDSTGEIRIRVVSPQQFLEELYGS